MIAAEDCALVLLAAGSSRRFGAADKLEAELWGRPLALHVVAALGAVPFGLRVAVRSASRIDFAGAGYVPIDNPAPEEGMAGSLRLGIEAAERADVAAALIVLADMPRVTATLVQRLLDAAEGPSAVVAASDGTRSSPPALFGRARFAELRALDGDAGARTLIRGGRLVIAGGGELLDVDRPEDLARLAAIRGAARRSD